MPWYHPVTNDAGSLTMSSLDRSNLSLLVSHRDGLSAPAVEGFDSVDYLVSICL